MKNALGLKIKWEGKKPPKLKIGNEDLGVGNRALANKVMLRGVC